MEEPNVLETSGDEDPLQLLLEESGDVTVVTVSGEVNARTCDQVRDPIMRSIEFGTRRLVLDMTRVTFIDSSGLRIQIGIYKTLERLGGVMTVLPSDSVARLFSITSQYSRLVRADTFEEALEYVRS